MIIVVFFIIQRLKLQKKRLQNPFLKKTLDNVFLFTFRFGNQKKRSGRTFNPKIEKNRIYKHFNYVANRRTFAKQVNKNLLNLKPSIAGWRLKPARRGREQRSTNQGETFHSHITKQRVMLKATYNEALAYAVSQKRLVSTSRVGDL